MAEDSPGKDIGRVGERVKVMPQQASSSSSGYNPAEKDLERMELRPVPKAMWHQKRKEKEQEEAPVQQASTREDSESKGQPKEGTAEHRRKNKGNGKHKTGDELLEYQREVLRLKGGEAKSVWHVRQTQKAAERESKRGSRSEPDRDQG